MAKYLFKPYDPIFPRLFEKEERRLRKLLDYVLIEHVGSTAILGLGGKGIIDIAIQAPEEKLSYVSKALKNLGYKFVAEGGSEGRLFFEQDLPDSKEKSRRYHVHLITEGNLQWQGMIAFRNFLRVNKKFLREYANIKKEAVEKAHEERGKYIAIKDPIIKKILKEALKQVKVRN